LTEEDILVLEPPRQREERGRHLAAAGLVVDRWWLTPSHTSFLTISLLLMQFMWKLPTGWGRGKRWNKESI